MCQEGSGENDAEDAEYCPSDFGGFDRHEFLEGPVQKTKYANKLACELRQFGKDHRSYDRPTESFLKAATTVIVRFITRADQVRPFEAHKDHRDLQRYAKPEHPDVHRVVGKRHNRLHREFSEDLFLRPMSPRQRQGFQDINVNCICDIQNLYLHCHIALAIPPLGRRRQPVVPLRGVSGSLVIQGELPERTPMACLSSFIVSAVLAAKIQILAPAPQVTFPRERVVVRFLLLRLTKQQLFDKLDASRRGILNQGGQQGERALLKSSSTNHRPFQERRSQLSYRSLSLLDLLSGLPALLHRCITLEINLLQL
mmetsp:Transcript_125659/g.287869  ORF Transcript_125659/g.287869 Transcript_125659/m.287869 type:complete len:312 (+) Transcript_125659:744-1679(+)